MQKPVPKGIVQSADQTSALHKMVSSNLKQAGFEATPQSVNPEDNSPLKAIEETLGDTAHIVGSTTDELIGGSTSDTARVRSAEGKVPTAIAAVRRFKQRLMGKAA